MNAERLHVILRAVRNDLQNTEVEKNLQELVKYLQNQVNQPQQPQPQQQVSTTLSTLYKSLERAPSNDFPPTWRQVLEQTGTDEFLGNRILDRIKDIFSRNKITPSLALEEIKQIYDGVRKLGETASNVMLGFEHLKIGWDELEAGECEVGILIPRSFVHDKLGDFGRELDELNKILNVFAEVSTGNRPGFVIREISSSDLSVLLDAAPAVGACLALAAERIVALYKNVLEIRKLRNGLKELDVPKASLKGVDAHANAMMEKEIERIVPELLDQFFRNTDDGRRNEIKTELKLALKKIANRVDRGFNIEIRVKPTSDQRGENGEAQAQERTRNIEIIQSVSGTLNFLKTEGDPILSLPESAETKDKKKRGRGLPKRPRGRPAPS